MGLFWVSGFLPVVAGVEVVESAAHRIVIVIASIRRAIVVMVYIMAVMVIVAAAIVIAVAVHITVSAGMAVTA